MSYVISEFFVEISMIFVLECLRLQLLASIWGQRIRALGSFSMERLRSSLTIKATGSHRHMSPSPIVKDWLATLQETKWLWIQQILFLVRKICHLLCILSHLALHFCSFCFSQEYFHVHWCFRPFTFLLILRSFRFVDGRSSTFMFVVSALLMSYCLRGIFRTRFVFTECLVTSTFDFQFVIEF